MYYCIILVLFIAKINGMSHFANHYNNPKNHVVPFYVAMRLFEATNSEVFLRLLSLQRSLLTFALSGWVWVNQALLFDDCG